MQLYDGATAPSPRRVRSFLAEKGISLPTRQVDLRGGEQLRPAFRATNEDGTVPVLVRRWHRHRLNRRTTRSLRHHLDDNSHEGGLACSLTRASRWDEGGVSPPRCLHLAVGIPKCGGLC